MDSWIKTSSVLSADVLSLDAFSEGTQLFPNFSTKKHGYDIIVITFCGQIVF